MNSHKSVQPRFITFSSRQRAFCGALFLAVAALAVAAASSSAGTVQFVPGGGTVVGAFSGTGVYDPVNIYSAPGGYGVAFLLPPVPIELPRGGVDGGLIKFQTKLDAAQGPYVGSGPGKWSYVAAGADLAANSLQVTSYDVHGGADYVGYELNNKKAGLAVHLANPPAAGNTHWIQVIADNHDINGAHGTFENIIDNNNNALPYYDGPYVANATNFLDAPRRDDPTNNHYWIADLYLVSGPMVPGQITIYNGLAYGWANIFVPTANLFALADAINTDLASVANFGTAMDADLTAYIDQSTLDTWETEFQADFAAIPEPATIVLLIVGLPAMIGLVRRQRRGT